MRDDNAHTTRALLAYVTGITSRRYRPDGGWTRDEFLAFFDLARAPIFSHGEFMPWNVMVHEGASPRSSTGLRRAGTRTFGTASCSSTPRRNCGASQAWGR